MVIICEQTSFLITIIDPTHISVKPNIDLTTLEIVDGNFLDFSVSYFGCVILVPTNSYPKHPLK